MLDPKKPNLGGVPTAPWRPRCDAAPDDPEATPAVSIVTALTAVAPSILDTAESVLAQTLQAFEWIVVDDRIEDPDGREILDLLARRDPRIRALSHLGRRGRLHALDTAVVVARTPLVFVLDAGCQLEATALEKQFWALESHPAWAFVASWSASFGDAYAVRETGFGRPADLLRSDPAEAGALVRRSAIEAAGGFAEAALPCGGDTRAFWLRCAERRLSGGGIAEVLGWVDAAASPEDVDASALARHFARVLEDAPAPTAPDAAEPREELPILDRWKPRAKRIVAVFRRVGSDGSGALWLDALAALKQRGWRVTVVCAEAPDADACAALARISCDVHVLSRFLRPADQPRFLRHLVESRGPEWVLLGAGPFGRAAAAYLRARCAGIRYAELRHADPDDGDAPLGPPIPATDVRLSTDPQDAGCEAVPVVVIEPAVDPAIWSPRHPPREWLRPQWGAAPDDLVVTCMGRFAEPAAALLVIRTMQELLRRDVPVRLVSACDGDGAARLAALARSHALAERVITLGRQGLDGQIRVLSASDVFLAPDAPCGSIATLRAMACERPVVQLPRLVRESDAVLRDAVDALADRVAELAIDAALRAAAGRAARATVLGTHGTGDLVQHLLAVLGGDSKAAREPAPTPRAFESAVAFFASSGAGAPT
jgi:glycosyltransferase involved in cell wall biosynthesis